jgi:hypothetical protein
VDPIRRLHSKKSFFVSGLRENQIFNAQVEATKTTKRKNGGKNVKTADFGALPFPGLDDRKKAK